MVDLASGWNNVLYNGAVKAVEQALGNCLASAKAVFWWNVRDQAYTWWFKGAPAGVNTLTSLGPGQILWVQSDASCSWQQT